MKKKKGRVTSLLLFLVFLAGLSLLLYPTAANYWNSLHQTKAIASYSEKVAEIDENQYEALWQSAQKYNSRIFQRKNIFVLSEEERAEYESLLDVSGTGVMGYIEIPEIDVTLPIYHGTSEGVLQIAVGHLDWTSLPTGGEGTHCVLSGHRGLPSAKLFTRLDKIVPGDIFMIQVLNETLTYEVDQILTVNPEDITALQIVDGMDYCTLVTCTPYGINTHRLLVRGHRIKNIETSRTIRVAIDAIQIEPFIIACIMAVPLLIIIMIWTVVSDRKNAYRNETISGNTEQHD